MIQGLHSSLAKLTAQFSVSLQWVPVHVGLTGNEKADLQKSAVRLHRHRTLSPTERQRHFSTLGAMETGRKKMVDTRHSLTQCGDWSGPSRPLSSASAQGTVVWVPIWRGLAFQTLPCVCGQADQTPDHVLQSCPKCAERCQLTWPHGADLATELRCSAEDLYRTAGFVASAGLKIWPVRLLIAEEEEEGVKARFIHLKNIPSVLFFFCFCPLLFVKI